MVLCKGCFSLNLCLMAFKKGHLFLPIGILGQETNEEPTQMSMLVTQSLCSWVSG